jgi:hypothetical protein
MCGSVQAAEIEPLIIMAHMSDPTMSRRTETTTDFLGIGATITFGRHVEADLALGRKATNCGGGRCPSEYGGMASVKWRPWRQSK